MTGPSPDFCAFSARLGQDPLRVQGPGGNTSIKMGAVMWIKASGTELADAERASIFVAVNRDAAKAEAAGDGDGSCKDTVIDPANTLRPSIETTFHAALNWPVVAHTHSIATLVHAISPEGREVAAEKLADLHAVFVPYAKPGLPLTREILARVTPDTQVVILQNHGLICCGKKVAEADAIMQTVEDRLAMPVISNTSADGTTSMEGFETVHESWMAHDPRVCDLALGGSYYPDHVVFLGRALPTADHDEKPPVVLKPGEGVYLRSGATSSQRAMIKCLSDCLSRLPAEWTAEPIGTEAEAALLNWDAEKYRQALAAR
ncbi:rhamnose utilization protein RhaD (predicted bifunctional aldolase and dehydrogenase) [Yoonia maricola]|uniref:Rhamnose utilization protein RhaD (Predicted bifunctional aldolase and dehydrogenase) n=1 Tax=Yoonia maricola TaxID=420999 RepID=A0A2M8W0G1_9RHOB|nr:class II aldolase/adducin family protein [Yoonia maricola]PJI84409.1 rhamnose utilization protein RhaD (predicted bifunctional aldolase and dehydrogenase) [Yoonia maricola]